jgi:hypothetical protein
MVWRHDGAEELIIQGKGCVAAYSMKGGEPKWWVRGWGFAAVTTPVADDGLLFAGGSGMGDPSESDDPLFDWEKLVAEYDANKDGQIALDEMPKSVVWQIRKEAPIDVPGNGFPMHDLMAFFVDAEKNRMVTKAEWDLSGEHIGNLRRAPCRQHPRGGGGQQTGRGRPLHPGHCGQPDLRAQRRGRSDIERNTRSHDIPNRGPFQPMRTRE